MFQCNICTYTVEEKKKYIFKDLFLLEPRAPFHFKVIWAHRAKEENLGRAFLKILSNITQNLT